MIANAFLLKYFILYKYLDFKNKNTHLIVMQRIVAVWKKEQQN